MAIQVKKWILAKPWDGAPRLDNFEMKEETVDVASLKQGEVLCEAIFHSVDPYVRISPIYEAMQKGSGTDTMIGTQVARVTHSKSSTYPLDCFVVGELGWRTHTITAEDKIKPLPEMGDLPKSLALGTLGLTGVTGYLATTSILQPKKGDVFVVSSAAGAVGSLVGQIAKIMGCTVVGFAGNKDKCDWLKNDLDFDYVFNYKETSLDEAFKSAAPNGVDCYFDNVGGDFTSSVIQHMAMFGRIVIVGTMSTYTSDTCQPKGPYPFFDILLQRLKIQAFCGWDHVDRWPEAIQTLRQWIEEGKIIYREHVTEGFENMPGALIELFKGGNIGKAIVKS